VYGTTQKLQYLLQPSMIETKALGPFDPRRRQMVELLDLGKRNVDLRPPGALPAADQVREPVQRLRSKTTSTYGARSTIAATFLARDAAADPDHQARLQVLQVLDASEVGEHLVLRLLAHGAGVEEDHVGVLGAVRRDDAVGGIEHVGHLVESYSFIWHPNVRM